MKKLFMFLMASATLMSCSKNADTSTEDANLATFKENSKIVLSMFKDYSNNDFSRYESTMSDSGKFVPPTIGTDTLNKAENLKGLQALRSLQSKVNFGEIQFLPTVDSVHYKPDGNVRVFTQWTSDGKNGAHVVNNYFAIFEFNSAHQVILTAEYQDMGGIWKALNEVKK
jgi:hypothetical protein